MPNFVKTSTGWRCQIYVDGKRESKTFRTKREADAWGAAREVELREEKTKHPGAKFTFAEAMEKYKEEVSVKKKGAHWEILRIDAMLDNPFLHCKEPVRNITTTHLGEWRDARLKEVAPGTVLREINLLSDIFEITRREWKWIEVNPMRDTRKPKAPDHRDIVITRQQVRKMLVAMRYSPTKSVRTVSVAAAVCFMLALRTGMRAGELCKLTWDRIHDGYCVLNETKTKPRQVPLTKKAMILIEQMRGWDDELVFGLKSQSLDALFRRYRTRAKLSGFTFHDSRHTAATWIAGRMRSSDVPAQQAVFDMCKMFGWKNVDQALAYYNPKASDIAKRMN